MTTVATNGQSMAADGFVTDRGTIVSSTHRKMVRLNDGRVVGFAGPSVMQTPVIDWLQGWEPAPKFHDDEGVNFLVLNTDGRVEHYDWRLEPLELAAPAAIGSGMDFALAAMDMGATPAEAVAAAARRDTCTGGEIIELWPGLYSDVVDIESAA